MLLKKDPVSGKVSPADDDDVLDKPCYDYDGLNRSSAFIAELTPKPRNEAVSRVADALMAEIADLSAIDARALAAGGANASRVGEGINLGTAIVVLDRDEDDEASVPMAERTVPDARVHARRGQHHEDTDERELSASDILPDTDEREMATARRHIDDIDEDIIEDAAPTVMRRVDTPVIEPASAPTPRPANLPPPSSLRSLSGRSST